jgi:DNA-binding response OmpR family regulator
LISLPPGFYDPATHRLHGPDGAQHLSPAMHHILMTLAEAQGRAIGSGMLIERLWAVNDEPEHADASIKVRVHHIRRAMRDVGIDQRTIGTRHHIGYFLAPMPVAPAIAITADERKRLRRMLETHHDRTLVEPLRHLLD